MDNFKLGIYALGENGEYIPLLVGVMVIFSTAFFGFILPKIFDYYHTFYRDELKNALSIEKSLKERQTKKCGNKYSEPDMDKIIDHYKVKYLENRLHRIDTEDSKKKNKENFIYWGTLGMVSGSIIVIAILSLLIVSFLRWSFGT